MNRILSVEDDKDISRELKELLENSGYEAVVLTDFKNASDSMHNRYFIITLLQT